MKGKIPGNLHQSRNGIAGHAKMVLEGDFGRIFDLLVAAAERCGQSRRGHGGGGANFTLTTHFSA